MIVPTLSTVTFKATLIATTGPIGALLIAVGNILAWAQGFDATLIAGAITTIGFALWGVVIVGYGRWHKQRIEAISLYEEAFRSSLQGQLKEANTELARLRDEIKALREENGRLTRTIDVLGKRLDAQQQNDTAADGN